MLRNSKKCIGKVVRGFYLDPRHLENMFKYLTNTSLTKVVEDNFVQQIDYMEAYLREMIQTAEFYEFMESIELKCEAEYDGSMHFKWLNILVRDFLFRLCTNKLYFREGLELFLTRMDQSS